MPRDEVNDWSEWRGCMTAKLDGLRNDIADIKADLESFTGTVNARCAKRGEQITRLEEARKTWSAAIAFVAAIVGGIIVALMRNALGA